MNNTETSLVNVSLFNVVNNRHCPQCGGLMNESDRCKKDTITFVRLECIKINCDGQWFQSSANLLPRRFEQTVE